MRLDNVEITEVVLELVPAEAIHECEAFFDGVREEEAAGSGLTSYGHPEL